MMGQSEAEDPILSFRAHTHDIGFGGPQVTILPPDSFACAFFCAIYVSYAFHAFCILFYVLSNFLNYNAARRIRCYLQRNVT